MSPLSQRAWSGARTPRRSLVEHALRAALPAAMLLAALLTVTLSADRTAASESLFLALWAAAVFAPLALLETASRPIHVALGLAATALVATLPRSAGLRPVVVAAVLALSILILASLALTLRKAPDLRISAALALAAAIVLHGHRLFLHGFSPTTFVLLALVPAVAAAVAAKLAAAGWPGAGLAVALALLLAPQLASEPWWILLAFATAALCAAFGSGAAARFAQRSLFFLRRRDAPGRQFPLAARGTGRDAARGGGNDRPAGSRELARRARCRADAVLAASGS